MLPTIPFDFLFPLQFKILKVNMEHLRTAEAYKATQRGRNATHY